jgi:hypothetical protein
VQCAQWPVIETCNPAWPSFVSRGLFFRQNLCGIG